MDPTTATFWYHALFHVYTSFDHDLHAELHPHVVADAFYNGEIENEIRQLAFEGWQVTDFSFRSDSDQERIMEEIENVIGAKEFIPTMNVQLNARSKVC